MISKYTVLLLFISFFLLISGNAVSSPSIEERSSDYKKTKQNQKGVRFERADRLSHSRYLRDECWKALVMVPLHVQYRYSGRDYAYSFSYYYRSSVWYLNGMGGSDIFIRPPGKNQLRRSLEKHGCKTIRCYLKGSSGDLVVFAQYKQMTIDVEVSASEYVLEHAYQYSGTVRGVRERRGYPASLRACSKLYRITPKALEQRVSGFASDLSMLDNKAIDKLYKKYNKRKDQQALAGLNDVISRTDGCSGLLKIFLQLFGEGNIRSTGGGKQQPTLKDFESKKRSYSKPPNDDDGF